MATSRCTRLTGASTSQPHGPARTTAGRRRNPLEDAPRKALRPRLVERTDRDGARRSLNPAWKHRRLGEAMATFHKDRPVRNPDASLPRAGAERASHDTPTPRALLDFMVTGWKPSSKELPK